MKTITKLTLVALFVCLSAVAALSQARSIKSLEHFHSAEDGFNIALPADMVQKSSKKVAGNDRRMFVWEFSDALVAVGVETRAKAATTDEDVAAIVAEYKAGIPKDQKILSESPASIGEYRGKTIVTEKDGAKAMHIIVAWKNFSVLLLGGNSTPSLDTQKLVLEAVQSFEFVH